MALAVSVGSVVINWTSNAQGIENKDGTGICEKINIKFTESNFENDICFNRETDKIEINVNNQGEAIEGVRLNYQARTADIIDTYNKIKPNEVKKLEINYDVIKNGELTSAKLSPFVYFNNNYVYCTGAGDYSSQIKDCVE